MLDIMMGKDHGKAQWPLAGGRVSSRSTIRIKCSKLDRDFVR